MPISPFFWEATRGSQSGHNVTATWGIFSGWKFCGFGLYSLPPKGAFGASDRKARRCGHGEMNNTNPHHPCMVYTPTFA